MYSTQNIKPKLPLFKMWVGGAWVNDEETRICNLWLQFQWFGKTIQKKLCSWKQSRIIS